MVNKSRSKFNVWQKSLVSLWLFLPMTAHSNGFEGIFLIPPIAILLKGEHSNKPTVAFEVGFGRLSGTRAIYFVDEKIQLFVAQEKYGHGRLFFSGYLPGTGDRVELGSSVMMQGWPGCYLQIFVGKEQLKHPVYSEGEKIFDYSYDRGVVGSGLGYSSSFSIFRSSIEIRIHKPVYFSARGETERSNEIARDFEILAKKAQTNIRLSLGLEI